MKPFDIYVLVLITLFVVGIIGAVMTGDVRWLGLSVIPGAVFWRWIRV